MSSSSNLAQSDAMPAAANDEALERAWSVLESVPDPEIPVVSIRELSILRGVARTALARMGFVVAALAALVFAFGRIRIGHGRTSWGP